MHASRVFKRRLLPLSYYFDTGSLPTAANCSSKEMATGFVSEGHSVCGVDDVA